MITEDELLPATFKSPDFEGLLMPRNEEKATADLKAMTRATRLVNDWEELCELSLSPTKRIILIHAIAAEL